MSHTENDCRNVLKFIRDNPDKNIGLYGVPEFGINEITIHPILLDLGNSGYIDIINKITKKGQDYLNGYK